MTVLPRRNSLTVMAEKKYAHLPGPTRLEKWRDGEELTQQQAADLMGFDLASYNAFENGRERPGLEYAVSIERVTKGRVEPRHWVEEKTANRRAS